MTPVRPPAPWDPAYGPQLQARRRERQAVVAAVHAWLAGPEGRAQLYRELAAAGIRPDDYERRRQQRGALSRSRPR